MKENIKKAFSLFELLIVLAIISVLTVMFISISKQGIESAYNRYFYASYKAMADAISYANDRNYDAMLANNSSANITTINNSLNYYYVGTAFGFKKDSSGNDISGYQYTTTGSITYPKTSNGVIYQIDSSGSNYVITATLPSANGDFNAKFIYIPDANNGLLVPYQATTVDGKTINLYERKDLLPFYIDNGINGRSSKYIKRNDSNNLTLSDMDSNSSDAKRTYDSFLNTYCSLTTKKYDDSTNSLSTQDDDAKDYREKVLNAIGVTCSEGDKTGFIKVANPQKVL